MNLSFSICWLYDIVELELEFEFEFFFLFALARDILYCKLCLIFCFDD